MAYHLLHVFFHLALFEHNLGVNLYTCPSIGCKSTRNASLNPYLCDMVAHLDTFSGPLMPRREALLRNWCARRRSAPRWRGQLENCPTARANGRQSGPNEHPVSGQQGPTATMPPSWIFTPSGYGAIPRAYRAFAFFLCIFAHSPPSPPPFPSGLPARWCLTFVDPLYGAPRMTSCA